MSSNIRLSNTWTKRSKTLIITIYIQACLLLWRSCACWSVTDKIVPFGNPLGSYVAVSACFHVKRRKLTNYQRNYKVLSLQKMRESLFPCCDRQRKQARIADKEPIKQCPV